MIAPILALFSALLLNQEPAMPGLAIAERVSGRAEAATAADCDLALAESRVRNAEELFIGASVCGRFERTDDAIFLILAAQARAMADMELAVPVEMPAPNETGVIDMSEVPPPPDEVIDLWAFIYAYGGGAGPSEFYRDAGRTDRLFERLRSWRPERPSDYDPGWSGSRDASDAAYAASISNNIEHRIEQLTPLGFLYRDDVYFALQEEMEALLTANNNTFVEGSPAQQRYEEIEKAKSRRQRELGIVF